MIFPNILFLQNQHGTSAFLHGFPNNAQASASTSAYSPFHAVSHQQAPLPFSPGFQSNIPTSAYSFNGAVSQVFFKKKYFVTSFVNLSNFSFFQMVPATLPTLYRGGTTQVF